ncbi:MAG: imidazole glycerol phosphate synthase subunit HisF [Anaerolineales bacterium]|nr:imidazole glycerol phosphate synthase subunit HisF [Anaerolineales bacterium]
MRFTRPRVIPCLLLHNKGLVKTRRFRDPVYLGDPINVVKLFNDKEVDELIFLDISATVEDRAPNFRYLAEIATECFMPLGYGGGVRTVEHARQLTALGVEKIVINSYVAENPAFVRQAADLLGSSSVVVSMDVKRSWLGKYQVFTQGGRKNTGLDPEAFAVQVASMGAGEIMVNSIDRDGMMQGYDVALVRKVAQAVDVPVIACGGAGGVQDFSEAVFEGHASAVAAGSMFVFQGKHRAVLISYPGQQELDAVFAAPAG